MSDLVFKPETEAEIVELLAKYPTKKAALLPVLHLAQRDYGWMSDDAMALVAKRLDLPVAHVYGVVTFYTMYHQKPVGKYVIEVCRTLSCAMMGAEKITRCLEKKLGIKVGETTPDNLYTLAEVECLASCGTAPAASINGAYYENLTPEKVGKVLQELK